MVKNKKAVLRIIEASIAIIIILTVVLIIVSNQKSDISRKEEILTLQRNILSYVIQDDNLRSEILSNNLTGTITKINSVIPSWLNYSVMICNYSVICNMDIPLNKEVYSNEALVLANLTYIPENPKKLKLFFWEK